MKILVAEDHERIAETYKLILESEDHEVVVTLNGQQCIEKYDEHFQRAGGNEVSANKPPFDIVILDYNLPIKDGIEIARHILSLVPDQRLLIASSYPIDVITRTATGLHGAIQIMIKPFDLVDLVSVVSKEKTALIIGA